MMAKRGNYFDPLVLEAFLTVVETGSFTETARRLDVRQSTVSQQISRLEASVGQLLLVRDTHRLTLTTAGRAFVEFARNILDAHERAARYFEELKHGGLKAIRLGAGADFGQHVFSRILPAFRERHPSLNIDLRIGVSNAVLLKELDAGNLDLAVLKHRQSAGRGRVILRDNLVWVARDASLLQPDAPVPLVVLDEPSTTRAMAIEALYAAGRSWRIACTSDSVNGMNVAILAGMGVGVQMKSMVSPGLVALTSEQGLPELLSMEYAVICPAGGCSPDAELLARALLGAKRLFAESLSSQELEAGAR